MPTKSTPPPVTSIAHIRDGRHWWERLTPQQRTDARGASRLSPECAWDRHVILSAIYGLDALTTPPMDLARP